MTIRLVIMKNSKTKILYFITGLKTGGAEMVLYNLIKGLNKDKFEPIVVSIIPIGEIGEKIQSLGIKVLSLNARFRYNPLIILKLALIFHKAKPKILHSHLFHADFLGRVIGKIYKVPVIISTIHSTYLGGFWANKLLQITNNLTDVVTVVSQKIGAEMINLKAVSSDKLRVIYNGIDLNVFFRQNEERKNKIRKDIGIQENEKVLISVGRLAKEKGYLYLIEAIKILKEEGFDIKLLIIGEGGERHKLERKIKELDLENNILLLGKKENIADYLSTFDVFILPSLWEGFSVVILEAMACELPIIATSVGGVPEIVQDGYSGFLVPTKDPLALAGKIDYVFHLSLEQRGALGRNGRRIVEKSFSLEKMIRNYEKLYEEFLSKTK